MEAGEAGKNGGGASAGEGASAGAAGKNGATAGEGVSAAGKNGAAAGEGASGGTASKEGGGKWQVEDFFNSETRKIPNEMREAMRKQIEDAIQASNRARSRVTGGPPGAKAAETSGTKAGGGTTGAKPGANPGARGPEDPRKTPLRELFEPRWRAYFVLTGASLLWYWYLSLPSPKDTNWQEFKVGSRVRRRLLPSAHQGTPARANGTTAQDRRPPHPSRDRL